MSPATTRESLGPRSLEPSNLARLVALGALLLWGCTSQPRSPSGGHPLLGQRAPSFDIPAQSGGTRASLQPGQPGQPRVVVVDFWATWCEPCKGAARHYQKLADRYPGQVAVIGVSEDDEPDAIASFGSSMGVRFPLAWDENKTLARAYSLGAMPSTFVLDASGVVRYVHDGFTPADERAIDREVAELIPASGGP